MMHQWGTGRRAEGQDCVGCSILLKFGETVMIVQSFKILATVGDGLLRAPKVWSRNFLC